MYINIHQFNIYYIGLSTFQVANRNPDGGRRFSPPARITSNALPEITHDVTPSTQ